MSAKRGGSPGWRTAAVRTAFGFWCIPASGRAGLHDADGFSAGAGARSTRFDQRARRRCRRRAGRRREAARRSSRLQARRRAVENRAVKPRVPCGTRNRQSLPGLPSHHRRAGRDDDLPGGVAVEHRGLVAVEAPAVRRLLCRGPNVRQIEARLTFRMRECQMQRAVGNSAAAPASACTAALRSAMRRSRRSRDSSETRPRPNASIRMPTSTRRRRARHGPRRSAAPASRVRRTASRYRR